MNKANPRLRKILLNFVIVSVAAVGLTWAIDSWLHPQSMIQVTIVGVPNKPQFWCLVTERQKIETVDWFVDFLGPVSMPANDWTDTNRFEIDKTLLAKVHFVSGAKTRIGILIVSRGVPTIFWFDKPSSQSRYFLGIKRKWLFNCDACDEAQSVSAAYAKDLGIDETHGINSE